MIGFKFSQQDYMIVEFTSVQSDLKKTNYILLHNKKEKKSNSVENAWKWNVKAWVFRGEKESISL